MSESRRSLAKRAAFALLGNPLVSRLRTRRIARAGVATILNLHRVAPFDGSTYPPLEPGLFRDLLRFCKTHFSIVTFTDLAQAEFEKPPLILSFDDGYLDFYTHACPIMEDEGVRCNQNLIPGAIESGRPPFNVTLGDFVGGASETALAALEIPGMARYRAHTSRNAYGAALSAFVKNRPIAQQRDIEHQALPQLSRDETVSYSAVMSIAQAREVASVHEIGAHSFDHASMAHETDDYLTNDLEKCRGWLRDKLSQDLRIYAFPNGSYLPHQVNIVRAAGVEHLLLVGEEFNRGSMVHHRFTFDAASTAEMRFRATGVWARP